jgi:septum formation protein
MTRPLLLASTSPRRQTLLREAGLAFEIAAPPDDEHTHASGLAPRDLVLANARRKAAAIARLHPDRVILSADTEVVLDDRVLGNPADLDDARRMLLQLAGRDHHVITGVVLHFPGPPHEDAWIDSTTVRFHDLDAARVDAYLARVPVLDKAGAYALQEHGELLVASVTGSRTNVVGLPVESVLARLKHHGL